MKPLLPYVTDITKQTLLCAYTKFYIKYTHPPHFSTKNAISLLLYLLSALFKKEKYVTAGQNKMDSYMQKQPYTVMENYTDFCSIMNVSLFMA